MKGFSSKTQLNNQFNLSDLARNLSMNREEKEEFKQVESITLTHALNTETTGLKTTDNIELIYIFQITLKTKKIPLKFLRVLDKKTKAHTVFEIYVNDRYHYIMANKKISDSTTVGDYTIREINEEWSLPESEQFNTLEDIYITLLAFVLNLHKRLGESVNEIVERRKKITELEKNVVKLERAMRAEKQPNIKMELNDKIKKTTKELILMEEE